ncbi:hypothetical protein Q6273_29740, partial [Klebsiella pneumoniae]|nr:hypothetical protein [Klebsiella pneumoniae]
TGAARQVFQAPQHAYTRQLLEAAPSLLVQQRRQVSAVLGYHRLEWHGVGGADRLYSAPGCRNGDPIPGKSLPLRCG